MFDVFADSQADLTISKSSPELVSSHVKVRCSLRPSDFERGCVVTAVELRKTAMRNLEKERKEMKGDEMRQRRWKL